MSGPDAALPPEPPASGARLPVHVVRLSDGGARSRQDFVIEPTVGERSAIARHLGLADLRKLRFAGRLTPTGRRDWTLDGELGATVVQDCVVTLAPVVTRIDEPVLRRYLDGLPAPGPGEIEMPGDDNVEELPASVDLCDVMIEALSLALPAFPRAPGAHLGEITLGDAAGSLSDAAAIRPFAELAELRRRLDHAGEEEPGPGPDPAPGAGR